LPAACSIPIAGAAGTLATINERSGKMADRKFAGVSVGGILVIAGIVVALVWSIWFGIVLAVVGLAAFGGFVRGKWY
jgi:hypothetical protein